VGISAFLLLLGVPDSRMIALVWLALCGLAVSLLNKPERSRQAGLSAVLVIGFVIVTMASIVLSKDVHRSIITSLYLEPALLVFFVIAFFYRNATDLIVSYGAFFLLALVIASLCIVVAMLSPEKSPSEWVKLTHIPILVVPNDLCFICLIPSLALGLCYYIDTLGAYTLVFCGIVLIAVAATLYQSRSAMLCLGSTLVCFFYMKGKLGALTLGTFMAIPLGLAAGIDIFLGKAMIVKSISAFNLDAINERIGLWIAAVEMFTASPLLGHALCANDAETPTTC